MGDVYQARDTKLDRDVALKVLEFSLENHHDEEAFSQDAVWCRRGTLPRLRTPLTVGGSWGSEFKSFGYAPRRRSRRG